MLRTLILHQPVRAKRANMSQESQANRAKMSQRCQYHEPTERREPKMSQDEPREPIRDADKQGTTNK